MITIYCNLNVPYLVRIVLWLFSQRSILYSYFRYVANPAKKLGQLLAAGEPMPPMYAGEILAGDPVSINVLTINSRKFSEYLEKDSGKAGECCVYPSCCTRRCCIGRGLPGGY